MSDPVRDRVRALIDEAASRPSAQPRLPEIPPLDNLRAYLRGLSGPLASDATRRAVAPTWGRREFAAAMRSLGYVERRMRYPRGAQPRVWWVREAP